MSQNREFAPNIATLANCQQAKNTQNRNFPTMVQLL